VAARSPSAARASPAGATRYETTIGAAALERRASRRMNSPTWGACSDARSVVACQWDAGRRVTRTARSVPAASCGAIAQPQFVVRWLANRTSWVVRTRAQPQAVVAAVRAEVARVDPITALRVE
jgi:hypothetical protein